MGLLDDAIREHLELKRLRGADPGEVAREQREALDPVPRDKHGEQGYHGERDVGGAPEPAHDGDFSHVGQETAELDMRTVLGEELNAPQDEPVPAPAGGGGHTIPSDGHALEDSLEWEPSGELAADSVSDNRSGEAERSAEDVLEETPDFLRDTPEQDRLWFEQQPPRDFDFDK
jgi:hypothetical protein